MRVRARTEADLPRCAALLLRVREATGYPVRRPDDPAAWVGAVGRAWVAEVGGELVGHVGLSARDDATAAVERLYVDPARAREGIGSALLATAADHAAARGLQPVLETVDRPGPLAFYATRGWHEIGRTQVDWAGGLDLVRLAETPGRQPSCRPSQDQRGIAAPTGTSTSPSAGE